jgi:hypothetical protein
MLLLKKKNVMGRKEEAPVRGYMQSGSLNGALQSIVARPDPHVQEGRQ